MTVRHSALPGPWDLRLQSAAARRLAEGRERSVRPAAGVDFCSNDYLGLRRDPRLLAVAERAGAEYGFGSGAARLLRGSSPAHEALEATLAAWKEQEAALLFNTGYQCNATVIPALAGPGDAVFSDRLNHASIVDGCRMARAGGAQVEIYRHLDPADLQARIRAWRQAGGTGLALVVTDAVFSMDGDAADLPALLAVCHANDALLMVDEAHATGLLGADGAGLAQAQGVAGEVLVMGTLGKALGAFGAFVACPSAMREHLVNRCRGFIFSTALPAPVAAAALEAIAIARAEPWRRALALAHAGRVRAALVQPEERSAIQPEQRSGIQPEQRSALSPEQRSGIQPEQRSALSPEQRSAIPPEERSTIPPDQRSVIPPEQRSTIQPEQRTAILPEHPSAIVPVLIGGDAEAMARAAALQALGFDVRAVRPPTVPAGTARLRITTGAHLQDDQVDALIEALGRWA